MKDKIMLAFTMLLWGSLGLITRYIDLSGISIAFLRAFVSLPVLYIVYKKNNKQRYNNYGLKKSLPFIFSGMLVGINWSVLFTAFNYTDISIAILIYNMCPVYVMIFAPIILKEKNDIVDKLVIILCFLGLIMLIFRNISTSNGVLGIVLAFIAGLVYTSIVIFNKHINTKPTLKNVNIFYITLMQMLGAAIVLFPFQFINNQGIKVFSLETKALMLILILGVVHTAFAYVIYFRSFKKLNALQIVSFSYFDPLFTIFLSFMFLKESMTFLQILGGIIILLSNYLNESRKAKASKINEQDAFA